MKKADSRYRHTGAAKRDVRRLDTTLSDPVTAFASGWMRVRARARKAASNCRW